jgi:hypothetical protein
MQTTPQGGPNRRETDRLLTDTVLLRSRRNRSPVRLAQNRHHLLVRKPALAHARLRFVKAVSQLRRGPKSREQVSSTTKADALAYGLNQWDGLCLLLEDGGVEIDSNTVEHSIRGLALTRKNALFAGHDRGAAGWAMIASLLDTCKLTGRSISLDHRRPDQVRQSLAGIPHRRIDACPYTAKSA